MHELGVVFHVIDQVKEIAKSNHVDHVNSVTVELGEVSTVIDHYLIDCWNWAVTKQELMTGCVLKIEKIQALSHCEDCNETFSTLQYAKICPKCSSEHTYLVQGNEFNLKEIEVV